MNTPEVIDRAEQYLAAADRVHAAYPHAPAMKSVEVPDLPAADGQLLAALRYVRDEVLTVRAGMADGVGVLVEELARARQVLAAAVIAGRCCTDCASKTAPPFER